MRSTAILAAGASLCLLTACEGIVVGEGEGEAGEGEGEGEGEAGEGEGEAGEGEGEGEGGEGEGEGGEFACSTGQVFAGFPDFDSEPTDRAEEGDPLSGVQGQPLLFRNIVFSDDHLITHIGQEIWASDLSAANPTIFKVAGNELAAGQELADGPCDDAQFANLHGLTVDAAGDLYVADQTGNAILKIVSPLDPANCEVQYWAGTSVDTTGITPDNVPNVGDRNGAGLQAQFALPSRVVVDDAGNLYVWDQGNDKIKKIAADADHTVSDLVPALDDDIVDAMVILDGKLYLYEHNSINQVFIYEVDTNTGARAEIVGGPGIDNFPQIGNSNSIQPGGMTTDGVDLFVYYKGIISKVDVVSGDVEAIAGDDSLRSTLEFDFPCDEDDAPGTCYDIYAEHPVDELQLPNRDQFATANAGSWLAIDENDDLYFSGNVLDNYVVKIECER